MPTYFPLNISRRSLLIHSGAMAVALSSTLAGAREPGVGAASTTRQIPARPLPVPDTVSDALKPVIGAPLPPTWNAIPGTADGWRAMAAASGDGAGPVLDEIQKRLGLTVRADTIGGVKVFVSTPDDMPARNSQRVLMHLHGGGYVLFPGLVGAGEGMMMAGYGRFQVISVDYRIAPDFPFPAALDDAITVWKRLLEQHDPKRLGIIGTSAGGGLALATALRARRESLAMPAAMATGSPWVDLTGDGDSLFANAFVDNVLVSGDGWVGAAARLYAGKNDLRDPFISPIYGDFTGLPPTILTSGTRDLLLSGLCRTGCPANAGDHCPIRHDGRGDRRIATGWRNVPAGFAVRGTLRSTTTLRLFRCCGRQLKNNLKRKFDGSKSTSKKAQYTFFQGG